MRRYVVNGVSLFNREAAPELQDSNLHLDWLHAAQVHWLNANRVRYEIFVLRVGDAYLLPAGCLHYFHNTEPSPVHSCLGFNVRVRRPQDMTAAAGTVIRALQASGDCVNFVITPKRLQQATCNLFVAGLRPLQWCSRTCGIP